MSTTYELAPNVWWAGSLDPDLRVFDIIMRAEHGTSYNSYIVKGSQSVAIIETVKFQFFSDFINKLTSLVNPSEIGYIVLNHMEPDHSGSIGEL